MKLEIFNKLANDVKESNLVENFIQELSKYLENAKEKGIKVGRPATKKDTIPKDFLRYFPDFSRGKINKKELASLTGFSRPTVIKYIKIIQEND